MGKIRDIYNTYTAAQLKSRSTIPAATDITANASDIDCVNIKASAVKSTLSAAEYSLYNLCRHANVNHWSWFGPTVRSVVSQELVNDDPTECRLGDFAGYNHSAATPVINEGGGSGGSKSYDYEGTDLLVRVRVELGEIDWTSLSADITHVYCILSYSGTEYFTLEHELSAGYGDQYIGATIDFGISADRAYSCALWFGKPANKKILKFPGFPAFTIEAVYAVPADVEVTSVNTIPDGLEYDRMNITFNFTNSGGPGNATIYWEMYNSSNVKIDEGNQSVSFASGSGNRALTGLTYPAAGTDYTLRVKETDDANWEVSNQFDAT